MSRRKPYTFDGKPKVRKSVGYGYVGVWNDGSLGWFLPQHLTGYLRERNKPRVTSWNTGEQGYLCKITIQLVKGKNGKPIKRRLPRTLVGE